MSSSSSSVAAYADSVGHAQVRDQHHSLSLDRVHSSFPGMATHPLECSRFLLGALEALLVIWLENASAPLLLKGGGRQVSSLDLQASLRLPGSGLTPLLLNESLREPCEVLLEEAARAKLRKVGVECDATCPVASVDPALWAKRKEDPVVAGEVKTLLKRLHPVLTLSEGGSTLLVAFSRAWMRAAAESLDLADPKDLVMATLLPHIVPPAHLKRCTDAGELACLVHGPRLALPPVCSLRMQLLDGVKPVGVPYSFTLPRKERLQDAFAHACTNFGVPSAQLVLLHFGKEVPPSVTPESLGVIKTATLYVVTRAWWESEGLPKGARPGGGGGGGGAQPPLPANSSSSSSSLPLLPPPPMGVSSDALSAAIDMTAAGEFVVVATGFGADTSPSGAKAKHVTGTAGGLGTSPDTWGKQPRLERASQKGRNVPPRDAATLLTSVLKSMNTIEDAMTSLASLAHALPSGWGEEGEGGGGGGGGGAGAGGAGASPAPKGSGAIMDLKALRATALHITEAGRELNNAISTVEINLSRGAVLEDMRKFAGRAQGKSPMDKARNMSPFVNKTTKGLSPRR